MFNPSKFKHFLTFFILIIVAAGILLYVGRGEVFAEMDHLNLIPQPERFTELYFNDYAALPKSTVANEPVSFSFTIHNVEDATVDYPYSVYFLYPDGAREIFASSSITLPANASTSITVNHTLLAANLSGAVVVLLKNIDEEIDFITPNTNP